MLNADYLKSLKRKEPKEKEAKKCLWFNSETFGINSGMRTSSDCKT